MVPSPDTVVPGSKVSVTLTIGVSPGSARRKGIPDAMEAFAKALVSRCSSATGNGSNGPQVTTRQGFQRTGLSGVPDWIAYDAGSPTGTSGGLSNRYVTATSRWRLGPMRTVWSASCGTSSPKGFGTVVALTV